MKVSETIAASWPGAALALGVSTEGLLVTVYSAAFDAAMRSAA